MMFYLVLILFVISSTVYSHTIMYPEIDPHPPAWKIILGNTLHKFIDFEPVDFYDYEDDLYEEEDEGMYDEDGEELAPFQSSVNLHIHDPLDEMIRNPVRQQHFY